MEHLICAVLTVAALFTGRYWRFSPTRKFKELFPAKLGELVTCVLHSEDGRTIEATITRKAPAPKTISKPHGHKAPTTYSLKSSDGSTFRYVKNA